jgi:hypothetical protein
MVGNKVSHTERVRLEAIIVSLVAGLYSVGSDWLAWILDEE